MARTCPTCHRPFGGSRRSCFACGRPILQKHKWHTVGCYMVHDDCQNPEMRTLLPHPSDEDLSPGTPLPEPVSSEQWTVDSDKAAVSEESETSNAAS